MDKRKFQIRNQISEITEEKKLLQENLEKITAQVHSCMDLINSERSLKPKNCSLILTYVLEVLKKFIQINYELECVIEESPLTQLLRDNGFNNFSSINVESIESEIKETPIVEKEEMIETSQLVEVDVACSLSQISEIVLENETENNLCEDNIQFEFKDAWKKYREKLGLDVESISSMTNFYQKRLSSCVTEYEKPSTSQIVHLNTENDSDDEFEFPEKDTNEAITLPIDEIKPDESDKAESDDVTSESIDESTNSIGNTEEKVKLESVDEIPIYLNCADTTEGNSREDCGIEETAHCLVPVVDAKIVGEGHAKTENDKPDKPKLAVYTALEKLNNTRFIDKEADAVAKMLIKKPEELVSFEPANDRIKNNLGSNGKKSKKKNKKNKNNETFYELVPKLPPQIGMDCVFSHIESPLEFYIHLVDDETTQIDALTDHLNEIFTGTTSEYDSKEDAASSIGNFCFAYITKYKSWYRAQIVDWEMESKSEDVVVQFVDYGDKRRISYKNLRKMTEEMAKIPMLAIRCYLPKMYPPDSTHGNILIQWPQATIDAMIEMSGFLGQINTKIFRIVYACQEENAVAIDMYNINELNESQTVGQKLLDWHLAVQIIDEIDEEVDSDIDIFLQDVDTLEQADNINEAVMGYDPRDEARICRFSKSDGTCFKGKNCKLEHLPLSKDGFTTDQIPVFKEAMYNLALPVMGQAVNILITGFKDSCTFYAQIVHVPVQQKNYVIDRDLFSLLVEMNNVKTAKTYEVFKVPPAIGEVVVVRHFTKKWLRAIVRDEITYKNDQPIEYQVYTLDFGDYLNVPVSDLRKIKSHFLELPFQIVECYLYDCIAREDCDKKKAKKFFLDNVYYRNFLAEVMSTSLPLKVAVRKPNGTSISKILTEHGFAAQRSHDNYPADFCMLSLF